MDDDRELLELAARSAGIDVLEWRCYYDGKPFALIRGPKVPGHWCPLLSDGDALRLAVKMNLWEAIRMAHRLLGDEPDMYAATRRAIVRAAAAIGAAAPAGAMPDAQGGEPKPDGEDAP